MSRRKKCHQMKQCCMEPARKRKRGISVHRRHRVTSGLDPSQAQGHFRSGAIAGTGSLPIWIHRRHRVTSSLIHRASVWDCTGAVHSIRKGYAAQQFFSWNLLFSWGWQGLALQPCSGFSELLSAQVRKDGN